MTLVLLHSAGATPALWDRVRTHLQGIPVVAPALPGRLGVEWPEHDTDRTVGAYARAVLSHLDALGIERATFAGHSLGGAVALELALDHRERVDGILLSCTGARLRVWPHVLEALADGVRDALDAFGSVQCGPNASDRDRVAIRRMLETTGIAQTHTDLLACDGFDVMMRLEDIRVPVRVLGATLDVCTPPKYAQHLAEQIPGARLVIYDGAAHSLPLELAEQVAAELAVFWAATTRAPMRATEVPAAGSASRSGSGP